MPTRSNGVATAAPMQQTRVARSGDSPPQTTHTPGQQSSQARTGLAEKLAAQQTAAVVETAPNVPTGLFGFEAEGELVRVEEIEGKGKGLVAARAIPRGALLFSEMPLCASSSGLCSATAHCVAGLSCECCGCWCGSSEEQLDGFCKLAGGLDVPPDVRGELVNLAGGPSAAALVCGGCSARWCSARCRAQSAFHGHGLLCAALAAPDGALHELQMEHQGDAGRAAHFGLAARVFARVAMRATRAVAASPSGAGVIGPDLARQAFEEAIGTFSDQQFTASLHAVRTGNPSPPPAELFAELLQPAYFGESLTNFQLLPRSAKPARMRRAAAMCLNKLVYATTESHLSAALETMREIFAPVGEGFLQGCLTDEAMFDRLLGSMNCAPINSLVYFSNRSISPRVP